MRDDVLIVGAGPTGLVAAHELAHSGIACRIIDKNPGRVRESRAIAIHSRTLEAFELMGLADDFVAAGRRIGAVNLYGEGGRIAHVGFGGLETRFPYVLAVPQDETERLLEQHLERLGVAVERNTELAGLGLRDSGAAARLVRNGTAEAWEGGWVLGCDGAHSRVRDALGVSFAGAAYPERFVLADVRVEGELDPDAASVWLAGAGPIGLFPLPGNRWRLILANLPDDWSGEPTLGQCQALLDARGPEGLRLADPAWTAVFRIHRRIAGEFRRGRAFLLGDAAHIHSPVGGQGMNTGIQDAFNLAWKLALVLGRGAPPSLLDSYEAERRPIDEAVVRQTDRATRLVSLHGSLARFFRDHLMALAVRLPAITDRLGGAVSGLAVDYRNSPIVTDHAHGREGPRAGDRAPDAAVEEAASGHRTTLYRLFAQRRQTLLVVGGAASAPQLPERAERAISVFRVAAVRGAAGELIDCTGEVAKGYGTRPLAYLVRPDGYIGFRCLADELAAHLPPYLAAVLG